MWGSCPHTGDLGWDLITFTHVGAIRCVPPPGSNSHNKTSCALPNLRCWNSDRTSDLPWFSYVPYHHKCVFVDFLIAYIGSSQVRFVIECRVVPNFGRRRSISSTHSSLWWLLFDRHRTTYGSNTRVRLRKHATCDPHVFTLGFQGTWKRSFLLTLWAL